MLTKYELIPFGGYRPLGVWGRDWDEVVDRFFGGERLPVESGEWGFSPVVDVTETEEGYELTAEVPGIKPEEIEVTLSGDILTLKGEKREEHEETKGECRLHERVYGSFYRGFRLREPVEREKISASHKDGVLRVSLPKVHKDETTRVEVKGN